MFNDITEILNDDNYTPLTRADESAIVLSALRDVCTEEEFNSIVYENAAELNIYGIIEDPEIVTEAKKIIIKRTKAMDLNREESKAALRLAKRANTADYKKYRKYRDLMLEARANIFQKHASKAKSEAKRVISSALRKAKTMTSVIGKTLANKLDKKVKEAEKKLNPAK